MDNGCSKHMARDPRNIITLERDQNGKVTFGDNILFKIIGKGTMALRNKVKTKNVLLVENLKLNLLSVSQTCD